MKVLKEDGALPIKMWLTELEPSALEQAQALARLPFAFHHIALMPDAHTGFGMPIGGVLATEDVVVVNAVGVDIGCGVNAVKSDVLIESATYDKVKQVIGRLRKTIPVGRNSQPHPVDVKRMPSRSPPELPVILKEYEHARMQMGTLGGGNHFVELQAGDDGFVWLMLHSGSRNLGHSIGTHYHELAVKELKLYPSRIPQDLAPLSVDSKSGQSYLKEMNWAMEYAFSNRKMMMENFQDAVREVFGGARFAEMINIAHNFASPETHFERKVWVHRKGATWAKEGMFGIVPGSQGTASYVVKGKGNKESFESCSHGAGRTMSRSDARKNLKMEDEIKRMEGIVNSIAYDGVKALDEAPSAYKDIETVMSNQADLVEPVVRLRPLGVLKG